MAQRSDAVVRGARCFMDDGYNWRGAGESFFSNIIVYGLEFLIAGVGMRETIV